VDGSTPSFFAAWHSFEHPLVLFTTRARAGRERLGYPDVAAAFAQRLRDAGLLDWICNNTDVYVAQAIAWASPGGNRRQQLSDLRAQLRPQLLASPLMDARQFAVDLDGALRGIWRAWCAKER
jgi:hypothetical protein